MSTFFRNAVMGGFTSVNTRLSNLALLEDQWDIYKTSTGNFCLGFPDGGVPHAHPDGSQSEGKVCSANKDVWAREFPRILSVNAGKVPGGGDAPVTPRGTPCL